ncbi:MAG: hypothetical protein QNJ40_06110 [Xanthomonadales bacterium]|nr:hypothetical protein [Xanthomonadales bacterium]
MNKRLAQPKRRSEKRGLPAKGTDKAPPADKTGNGRQAIFGNSAVAASVVIGKPLVVTAGGDDAADSNGGVLTFAPLTIYGRVPLPVPADGQPLPDQPEPAAPADKRAPEATAGQEPKAADKDVLKEKDATEKQTKGDKDQADKDHADKDTADRDQADDKPKAQAEPKTGEDGKPVPAKGGGGGERRLAGWKARVRGAAASTPKPTLGGSVASGVTVIKGAGSKAKAKRKAGGKGLAKSAKDAVRKPPETPKHLPPPPPTPVPAADKAIKDASNKKIPKQSLPKLKTTPKGTVPTMNLNLAAETGTKLSVPDAEPKKTDTGEKKGPDQKKLDKIKKAKEKEPDPNKTAKAGDALVIEDTAPPPPAGVELGTKGQSKEKVAQVLAELLKAPEKEAEKIVVEAREETYPKKALQREYPSLGEEFKADVVAELKNQVEQIRKVADISAAELDKAIKARSDKAKELKDEGHKKLDSGKDKAKSETKEGGDTLLGKIAGARKAVDEQTIQQMIAAKGEGDPEVIKLRRDKSLRDLTGIAARQDVYYEKSGERRTKALSSAHTRMRNAYKNAAKSEQKKIYDDLIKAEKTEDEAKKEAETKARPSFEWAAKQTTELNRIFGDLKSTAATTATGYRTGIKNALTRARQLLRDWAQNKIAEKESFWDKILRWISEWVQDAQDDSAAWEAARSEALRDTLVGDLNLIDEIHAAARSGVDMKTYIQERGLDAAQAAILQAYFSGAAKGDAIGAVAVGMRMRVRKTRKPKMIKRLKSKVMERPDGEYKKLARIGNAERPPFNVVALASDLYKAMDQVGTDEAAIYGALAKLTPIQAKALRARYQLRYGKSLDQHLKDELSGAELTRAEALLEGDQTLADVAALHEAMSGPGTDEDTIMKVLRNKNEDERKKIVEEYKRQYGVDLNAELKSELDDGWSSHHDFDRAKALMDGDTAKADAIALDQSMHGGIFGAGTDEAQMKQVYAQNRAEVEAMAAEKGWSTEQMEAEIKRRNAKIEGEYEKKYGDGDPNIKPGEKSALRQAFESDLSGAELDLANALADNNIAKADAARLEIERRSFITDDDAVNKVLESQAKRARKDVERDKNLDLNFRAEVDALMDKPWGPERWKKERANARKEIEKEARERGKLYMSNLENAYDSKYSKFGKGGLQVLIAFNMSGNDRQKAYDLLNQGGFLNPEQEIFYAVNGPGTDVDKLKKVLEGKSPEEIEKIRKAWKKRYPNEPDLDSRIKEEVSGRDAKDMDWALEGEPQTLEGKLKRARERMEYEETAYWLGSSFSKDEAADMRAQYEDLKAEKARLDKLEATKPKQKKGETDEDYAKRLRESGYLEEYDYWKDSFDLQQGYFDRAVEDHRAAVDELADTASSIAAIVATVIVIVVAAVLTGGTAGAAIVAALASAKVAAAAAAAAAVATVATKAALKGSAYSHAEIATDAIVGVVDAAASYLTAGVGGALLKTARGAPASRLAALAAKSKTSAKLAKMAASNKTSTRIFGNALAEGIEGVAASVPAALAGNVLNEKNWAKGNPLGNILTGTLIETGIGVGLSGGLGGLGGLGKHADDIGDALPSNRKALTDEVAGSGDLLGKRGTPAERLATWNDWQLTNPGKTYDEFLAEFDAGILAKQADEAAVKAMQREMRGELLSAIPPAQRGEFAKVPIEVMSDADFYRFTKSKSAKAVVIFEDGKPRVILREGADAKSLREEGIHLLQSKDPKFARKFKELDETRLANWDNLDIDEQFRLYRNKLDIEIDAQRRLLKNLDEELAGVNDPAMRRKLLDQREAAERNLRNLSDRLDEVDGLTPTQRMKMATGDLEPPKYLDQKPRLFQKDADVDADPRVVAVAEQLESLKKAKKELLDTFNEKAESSPVWKAIKADFEAVWKKYYKKASSYKGDLRTYLKAGKDPSGLFDAGPSLDSFLKAVKQLSADDLQTEKLSGLIRGVDGLLEGGLDRRIVAAASQIAPAFKKPDKILGIIGEIASLKNFRNRKVPAVGELLQKLTKASDEGADLAQEFGDELSILARLTEARDAIDKSKNAAGWLKAQTALEDAADALKGKASRFGLVDDDISPILEEFARSGRFNWKAFKEGLSDRYPVDKVKFGRLKGLIDDLKAAAKAGKKEWLDTDVGPILHWGSVLEKLYGSTVGAANKSKLISNLKETLKDLLPNLTSDGYKKYRHVLKNKVINHIFEKLTDPLEQLNLYRQFRELVAAKDSASIGEYFATFRRKIFDSSTSKVPSIQGELAGSVDIKGASRKLDTPDGSVRMADGAMDIQSSATPPRGPEPGRYLVEDKAGGSFDPAQARLYSEMLESKTGLKTADPGQYKGMVYFCEDLDHAIYVANHLKKNGLNPNIFVATFDEKTGKMVFVDRAAKPRVKKKRGKGKKP